MSESRLEGGGGIELHHLDLRHLLVQWPNRISLSARIVESSNKWQRRPQANSIQPQFQKESNSAHGLPVYSFIILVNLYVWDKNMATYFNMSIYSW